MEMNGFELRGTKSSHHRGHRGKSEVKLYDLIYPHKTVFLCDPPCPVW